MALDLESRISFSDFPDDVQLNILSFLRPIEISAFACTCRRFAALCSRSSPSTDLWLSLCDRRWGSKTQIRRWSATPSPHLYETLNRWERLIGFWRCIANGVLGTPSLLYFEWRPSCIIGSRISRFPIAASYAVRKVPFLWLGLSAAGETLSYIYLDTPMFDSDVIPATIRFKRPNHFVIDETWSFSVDSYTAGSSPDRVMSEIFQYFSNRTSPAAEKSLRRQRTKNALKIFRNGHWDGVDFFKIYDDSPTPTRPLQGLWKAISENTNLQFYLF